jgi:hypothetical protein
MQEGAKKYLDGGVNADLAEHLVPENCIISGKNIRIGGSTDKGGVGYIENILKNAEKNHVLPSGGTNVRIGFAADDEQGWIAKFNYNSIGDHGIYLYDIIGDNWYNLLLNASVTDGLDFQKNELIHSTRIENGCLYWCNGLINEPRRIDIRAAVNLNHAGTFTDTDPYTSPIAQSVIRWIRRQPALPLTALKQQSSSYINDFISDEGFWFSYRYIYRNYEISTLSALSELFNYNDLDDTENFIAIDFPLEETIEQDVLQVDLVVKYANSGKSFVIKSWNRNLAADLADINAHNSGTALNFDFANDFVGIALDDAYSVKPYDSLPIYAQTIEIARNRAFMGNYTLGYDTPTRSSLIAFPQTSDTATLTAQWVIIQYGGGVNTHYFLDLGSLGFFDVSQPSPPPYPSTTAYGTMTSVAIGPSNFAAYILANYTGWVGGIQYAGSDTVVTGGPPVPGIAGSEAFKSGASYRVSISFLDHAGRKCGIWTDQSLLVNSGERIYDQIEFTTGISWSLSNVARLLEIPIWAYSYSINVTKCLTTRFFLQSRVKNITYATKDADGLYVFNNTAYAASRNGVGIDITLLNAYGMGYTFTEGDLVKVYIASTLYHLSVVAQEGNWIICELQNLGTLGNTASPKTDALFELYTPYKPSLSEPHYEVGQIYLIDEPATANRAYSTLGGTIKGDVTILTRNDGSGNYLTENMSPNDKFPYKWNTHSGRPNFIDTIGQQTKTNDIAYSDVLLQGTKTNGLSTFEALNTKDVPIECGDIEKLQVANKITEQGNIMLAICVNETVSLYLGEAQLLGTSQTAFIAQSADVIGTINILQGSYGTMNPESVGAHNGRVFFYCLISGCFVQYSNAGLFPISDYGMKRVTHLFSQKYASLSQSEIEALGSRPFVFFGVDPYHEEVYWTIPKTESTPPKGYLEDYVSPELPIVYPYDIYDGIGKTLVYKINQDRWGAPHTYEAEGFINVRDYVFSAKNGALYKHNVDDGTDDTYNEWYGESQISAIGFIVNELPNVIKEFLSLSVEGNQTPTFTHLRCSTPNVQSSDLISEWVLREGVRNTPILRDRLSPNTTGTYDEKLFKGDRMRGNWLYVWTEFDTIEQLQIRYFNVIFAKSSGNKT